MDLCHGELLAAKLADGESATARRKMRYTRISGENCSQCVLASGCVEKDECLLDSVRGRSDFEERMFVAFRVLQPEGGSADSEINHAT